MTDPEATAEGVRVTASPSSPLFDEVVTIRVTGLRPGEVVALRATADDGAWSSRATFRASDDGVVDTAEQAPLDGSYGGGGSGADSGGEPDPMGLFWSLTPSPDSEPEDAWSAPTDVTVAVERDGAATGPVGRGASGSGPVATTRVRRRTAAEGVEETVVDHPELVGRFYAPGGDGPHPTLLLLGGSEGGRPPGLRAAVLASHGYAVLALAYFGADGLPDTLEGIPVEYFETAVDWLQEQPAVRTEPLGAIGWSRGAELALVLGARLDAVSAVVGFAPSAVRFQGIPDSFREADAAWTADGEPLAYVEYRFPLRFLLRLFWLSLRGKSVSLRGTYAGGLEDADAGTIEAATIPVEDVGGPVLLVSGEDDRMWPATDLAERAIARLDAHDYDGFYEHLSYPDAGHGIGVPYAPTTPRTEGGEFLPRAPLALGGTPAGIARADADAWSRVLDVLDEQFA